MPPEKAFQAEEEGLRVIADSLELDCLWVPLATTRRFLAANRELVKRVRSIYIESVRLFKNDPQTTLGEIRRWLPALQSSPRALQRCYKIFAESFEPTLALSVSSLDSMLNEVALQDSRAREIRASSLIDIVA